MSLLFLCRLDLRSHLVRLKPRAEFRHASSSAHFHPNILLHKLNFKLKKLSFILPGGFSSFERNTIFEGPIFLALNTDGGTFRTQNSYTYNFFYLLQVWKCNGCHNRKFPSSHNRLLTYIFFSSFVIFIYRVNARFL